MLDGVAGSGSFGEADHVASMFNSQSEWLVVCSTDYLRCPDLANSCLPRR